MKKFTSLAVVALAALLMCPTLMSAVTIGPVDNFEDGTTQNWVINLLGMGSPPSPPANIPTGGPAGVGDNYLQLTSTGILNTAGSRLVGVNYMHQWTGKLHCGRYHQPLDGREQPRQHRSLPETSIRRSDGCAS